MRILNNYGTQVTDMAYWTLVFSYIEKYIIDFFDDYLKKIGECSFQRHPLPPTGDAKIRYSNHIVDMNKHKSFMIVIAEKGGLSEKFMNHSGKRACATQWYTAGVLEQKIMNVIDHFKS